MQDKYKVGDSFTKEVSFSLKDVQEFARISQDINPIHLDEEVAADSIFKKPIVHGMLVSSTFSAIIANHIPGPGSIYLHQSIDFKRAVYHNQKVKATVEIISVREDKPIFELSTKCFDDDDNILIEGKAIVLAK